MSKATKRKHVAKEVLEDYVVPDPNQQIVEESFACVSPTFCGCYLCVSYKVVNDCCSYELYLRSSDDLKVNVVIHPDSIQIVSSRGNNLHEVEAPDGSKFLVSMPSKFRKSVWIKRGDFVIVDPIEEGNKVCAEIVRILYNKQIKYLKSEGLWPTAFTDKVQEDEKLEIKGGKSNAQGNGYRDSNDSSNKSSDEEDNDDDDLFVNPNHQKPTTYFETDSSDESENEA